MLRILFKLFIVLSIPAGFSSNLSNIESEIDSPNAEQVRQIGKCMIKMHEESLEIPISLKKDVVVYDFFVRKKGKKYKIYDGQCTLGKLKIFSEYLNEDIEILNEKKVDFKHMNEFTHSFSRRLVKLVTVKNHLDTLILTVIPEVITSRRAWKYFKLHFLEYDYFSERSKKQIKEFKPIFLAHVRDFYGIE